MPRSNNRQPEDVRELSFQRGFTSSAPGSVLAAFGRTRVLCTATYLDGVPSFLQGKGRGWLTAEYAMLPGSTGTRKSRERGRPDGRSTEIQRLIGRSLRAVVDFGAMTERTVWVDCDVIEADGGTRTTAITGAWVALVDLFKHMDSKRILRAWPLKGQLAAVSVGIVGGEALCDLDYAEDSRADVDLNLVMTEGGRFIELQGAAEGEPYDRAQLDKMISLGEGGVRQIFEAQKAALDG